jgi:NAD(P)-dependent dehydrogenase (short-subunit alcohol dehydrogenase family)
MVDLGYDGEVAIVTGGTRGIGFAIARALLDEGCAVAIAGRSQESLRAAAERLDTPGDKLLLLEGDLGQRDTAARFVAETASGLGGVDIVVNNAAGFSEGDTLDSPLDDWEDLFRLKLVGYLDVIRAAVPIMRQRRSGAIVNVSGVAGLYPMPGSGHAGVVNAAVINLTRLLAHQLAGDGIRVNGICPGGVATDRFEARMRKAMEASGITRDEAEAHYSAKLPTGRVATPEEVALMAVTLCSPKLRSLVGNNIVIDNGMSL